MCNSAKSCRIFICIYLSSLQSKSCVAHPPPHCMLFPLHHALFPLHWCGASPSAPCPTPPQNYQSQKVLQNPSAASPLAYRLGYLPFDLPGLIYPRVYCNTKHSIFLHCSIPPRLQATP